MKEWRQVFATNIGFIADFKQYFVLLCFIFLRRELFVSFEYSDVARSVPAMEGEGGDPLSVNKNPRIIKGNF
jgi:hypothetical protein